MSLLPTPTTRAVCNGWCFEDENGPAGYCGAQEGELHRFGGPRERCTKCGGQFLYCDCPEPHEERERVPFWRLGWQCCERCGTPWPDFFTAPNDVWQHYVLRLGDGNPILCIDCFKLIVEVTDGGACAREHERSIDSLVGDFRKRLEELGYL